MSASATSAGSFQPGLVILYVRDLAVSRAFYERLFGPPLEASQNFAMFATSAAPTAMRLAIWAVSAVAPPATAAPGGVEICAAVGAHEVEPLHAEWRSRGVAVAQPPTRMEFGHTFVALDPDGHRLRVFHPAD
jgi:predicted enzyme related to lactoylglutathione lyase